MFKRFRYCFPFFTLILLVCLACQNIAKPSEIVSNKQFDQNIYKEKEIPQPPIKQENESRVEAVDTVERTSKKELDTSKSKNTSKEPISTKPTNKKKSIIKKESLPVVKETKKKKAIGKIQFLKTKHDYGRIEMGEKVQVTFEFQNVGTIPLEIDNVDATCGCTTPIFPFLPIEPGKKGKISAEFNSKGRLGNQSSTLTVYSNGSKEPIELTLEGTVISEIVQPVDSL